MESPVRIGIDAMSLIYKYKNEYKLIFPYIDNLRQKGHVITFVFDGKAPAEKADEITERREARQTASTQAATLKEQLQDPTLTAKERTILEFSVARLEYQGWHLSREIRHEVRDTLDAMGIKCVRATEEADTVLTDMALDGEIDVVVSTDMDFLLSGVNRLWIPSRDGFEELLLEEVMHGEGVTKEGILDAGILCGVEPMHGVISTPPKTAFGWIRHYKTMEALLAHRKDLVALDPLRVEGELERVRSHFSKTGSS
jgi:5'-3' exonuclease